ncbi:PRC-barrel domain-containing protein [Xanthocytophaga flava]|uniref:PRC-barrel domain-containing protein n=1 Tax=Xanthocytophaga flava TaxID=3048013 RepID=UPI0028D0BD42|nr:PRC-barrel domain-containing protein [Xanthocytophaga flavus]MDJ1473832.1 PRC-barrel domain-containing protein [Xanthocytophaga flavus]
MNTPTLALGARLSVVKLKDQSGQEIGKVIEWLMDVEEGKVVCVIAEFEQGSYALPWTMMKADLQSGGYVIDTDKVKSYNVQVDRNALGDLVSDKNFLNQLYQTYQLPTYWQDNASTGQGTQANSTAPFTPGQAPNETAKEGEGKGYGG